MAASVAVAMRVVEKGVGKGAEMEVEKAVADMVAGTRVERMVGWRAMLQQRRHTPCEPGTCQRRGRVRRQVAPLLEVALTVCLQDAEATAIGLGGAHTAALVRICE